jgi:hypothetical protein
LFRVICYDSRGRFEVTFVIEPERKEYVVPKPVLQALVLADQVYQDKDTGKMIISGTFTRLIVVKAQKQTVQPTNPQSDKPAEALRGLSMPVTGSRAGSPFAYVCLTNIHGECDLDLRYVDLHDNSSLFQGRLHVTCKSALDSVELKVALPALPHKNAGHCALELLHENELLGSWRVQVIETAPPAQGTKDESPVQ